MNAERRVQIRVEVDPESDPISGLVHDGSGERHHFHGWLQFMAAIDAARSTAAGDSQPTDVRSRTLTNKPLP